MIVDAQVHLWKAEAPDRPWLPGRVAQLPEPFLIEKLVPMMDEAGVDRAVIVPPSWEGDRNDYALEAVRRDPERFDAVITDERMPGLRGIALARAIHVLRPDLPVILATGYRGAALDLEASRCGIVDILDKPLRLNDLARALSDVVHA